jgi:DNA-binding winged helix-turn-helix (wHTH) protein
MRTKAAEHGAGTLDGGHPDASDAVFAFDAYEVDTALLELRHHGVVVPLEPKPFLLLLHLIRNRHRMVSTEELVRALWPDTRVTKSSLATALYAMRRALGDTGTRPRWIATARGRGYRFAVPVEERSRNGTLPAPPQPERDATLDELQAVLRAALAGERRIALLHGPPGIGKTRAVTELARRAAPLGFEIEIGRVHESEGAPPFWPWIQLLRGMLESRSDAELQESLGGDAASVLQLMPELRARLGIGAVPAASAGPAGRFQLFDAIARFLAREARAKPLLLVLEDLHWADESSLALLLFVARNVHRAPLAIVGTHRELASSLGPSQAPALGRILAEPGSASLALLGLTREAVGRILRESLGAGSDAALVERVHAVTGGNPFFVTELARLLAVSTAPLESAHVPLCLQDAVRVRIAECSPACQALLRAAAAIGPRLEISILWRVMRTDAEAAVEALDEAERRQLLARGSEPGEYRFAHAVVRETLYADLGTAERLRLHRDIALAVEERGAPAAQLAELAHHFAEATPLTGAERAIRYARCAAEHASSVSAHDEAAGHYRRALRALDYLEPPDATLRCTLMVELGEALASAHAPIEAVDEAFSSAIQFARSLGLPQLLARAAVGSIAYAHGKDTLALLRPRRAAHLLDRLAPHLEHAAAALHRPGDARLRARALLALAGLHDAAGATSKALPLIASALACAQPGRDPALRAEALLRQWSTGETLDRSVERIALAREALELGQRAQRGDLQVTALVAQAFHALDRGDREELERAARSIERLAADASVPEALGAASAARCLLAQLDGKLDTAEAAIVDGVALASRLNYTVPRTTVMQVVQEWWLALLRGRAHAIASQWERLAALDPSLHQARFLLARLRSEVDPRRVGLDDLVKSLAELPRDDHWLLCASIAAELCARQARRDLAAPLLEMLRPHAVRSITVGWILICMGSVARPLGSLAALLRRWPDCAELFELALEHARGLRSPLLQVWTQHERARALQTHPRAQERRLAQHLAEEAARGAFRIGVALPLGAGLDRPTGGGA